MILSLFFLFESHLKVLCYYKYVLWTKNFCLILSIGLKLNYRNTCYRMFLAKIDVDFLDGLYVLCQQNFSSPLYVLYKIRDFKYILCTNVKDLHLYYSIVGHYL